MPSDIEDMAQQSADSRPQTHQYSLSRLLHIGCRTQTHMTLANFSVDAIQAGIVTGPAMPPKQVHFPLREVSNIQERGWSAESFDSLPGQAQLEVTVHAPIRQPRTAPTELEDQSKGGFARFLEEHSSPTHQRVTAGGRIVPVDPKTAPPEFKLIAADMKGNIKKAPNATKQEAVSGLIVANLEPGLASSFTGASKLLHHAAAGPARVPNGYQYPTTPMNQGVNQIRRKVANDEKAQGKKSGNKPADLTFTQGANILQGQTYNPSDDVTQQMANLMGKPVGAHNLSHGYFAPQNQSIYPQSGNNGASLYAAVATPSLATIAEEFPTKSQDKASQSLLIQRLQHIGSHVAPHMHPKPVQPTSAQLPFANLSLHPTNSSLPQAHSSLPQKPVLNGNAAHGPGAKQHRFPYGVGRIPMHPMYPLGQPGLTNPGLGPAHQENANMLQALEQSVTEATVQSAQKAFDDLGQKLRDQDGYTAQYVFDANLTAHYGRERAKIVEDRDLARRTLMCVRNAWQRKQQKEKERQYWSIMGLQGQGAHGFAVNSKAEKPANTNLNVRAAAWIPPDKVLSVASDLANPAPSGVAKAADITPQTTGQSAAIVPDFPINDNYDFSTSDLAIDPICHICPGVRVVKQNGEQELQLASLYQPGPYTTRYMVGDPLDDNRVDGWGIRLDRAPPHVARMQNAQAQFLEELMLQEYCGGSLEQVIHNIRQKFQRPAGAPVAVPQLPTQLPNHVVTDNVPSIKLNGNELSETTDAAAVSRTPIKQTRTTNVRKGLAISEPAGMPLKLEKMDKGSGGSLADVATMAGVDKKEVGKAKPGAGMAKGKTAKEFKTGIFDKVDKAKMKTATQLSFSTGPTQLSNKTRSSVSIQNVNADGMVPGSQMVPSFDGATDRLNLLGTLSTVARACRQPGESAKLSADAGTQAGSSTAN